MSNPYDDPRISVANGYPDWDGGPSGSEWSRAEFEPFYPSLGDTEYPEPPHDPAPYAGSWPQQGNPNQGPDGQLGGGPVYAQVPFNPQPGYPPGGFGAPGRSRKPLIFGAIAAVGIIVTVVAVVLALVGGGDGGDRHKTTTPQAAAKDLIVRQPDFPVLAGADFTVTGTGEAPDPDDDIDLPMTTANPMCQAMLGGGDHDKEPAVDSVSADLDQMQTLGSFDNYGVEVVKAADPTYLEGFDDVLRLCGDFTFALPIGGESFSGTMHLEKASFDGVNGPYNALQMTATIDYQLFQASLVSYMILYGDRGVSYSAQFMRMELMSTAEVTDEVKSNLVSLFNKQRQKILDAD